MRIISFGEVLWDIIDGIPHLGGAPFNLAAHLSKMGASSCLISSVGDDDLGRRALISARDHGIDTAVIRIHPSLPTGTVNVRLSGEGVPDFTIHGPAAWDEIELNDKEISKIAEHGCDALCLGTLAQRSLKNREELARLFEALTPPIVFYDVNIRQNYYDREWIEQSLMRSDVVKLNDDEARLLSSMFFDADPDERRFAVRLCESFSIQCLCITRGERGAAVYGNGRFTEIPGGPVHVADTVGAGDAFSAGFLYSRLRGHDIEESASFAVRIGSFVASKAGAVPEYSREILQAIRRI